MFAQQKLKSFREFEKKDWQLLTVSMVDKMVENGESVKSPDLSADETYDYRRYILEHAVQYSSPRVVQRLIDHGANPNPNLTKNFIIPEFESPIHIALGNGREDNVAILIKNGAVVNLSVMRFALEQVDLKSFVYRLLKKAFDKNRQENNTGEGLSHYDWFKYYEKIAIGYKPVIDSRKIVSKISNPKLARQVREAYYLKTEKELHREWIEQRRQRTRV